MALGSKLGSAHVTVEADTAPFGRGLAGKIRAEMAAGEKEAKAAGKSAGDAYIDGLVRTIERRLPVIRGKIQAMLRGLKIKTKVTVDVDVDVKGGSGTAGTIAKRLTGQIKSEIGQGAFSAARGIQAMFGQLRGLMTGGISGFAVKLLLGAAAAVSLAGAVNAIGREVLNLVGTVGLLPAGILAVVSVTGALKIAFLGVGDALEAVFDKDPKKLQEALKGLSREAREFVLDVKAVKPFLDRLKDNTQNKFFAQLEDAPQRLRDALGGELFVGLGRVSSKAGMLVDSLVDRISNSKMAGFLERLFGTVDKLIVRLEGPVGRLVDSLFGAADSSLPAFERAGNAVADFIDRFAAFIDENVKDGDFLQWLEDGLDTFGELMDFVKETTALLGVMFDNSNSEGDSFIVIITDMIRLFRQFLESPDGQLALEGIGAAAKAAGLLLIGLLAVVTTIILALGDLVAAVKRALEWIGILQGRQIQSSGPVSVGLRSNTQYAKQPAPGKRKKALGDIISIPETLTVGEAGPEVIIPLTNARRARQLMAATGLDGMTGGTPSVDVTVYIGDEKLETKMVRVSRKTQGSSVTAAGYGAHAAA